MTQAPLPAFLQLQGRACLVVGAGAVGWAKAASLLGAGALVTVVDPEIGAPPVTLAACPDLRLQPRRFDASDLEGKAVVVAATADPTLQQEVFAAARRAGVLVNVHDRPALCDFLYGATLRRGALQVAVSTGGRFPSLAVRIRNRIADWLGPRAGEALDELGAARDWLHEEHPADYETQRDRLGELLTHRLVDAVAAGDLQTVKGRIREWLSSPAR